ncbi:hypothetical protein [Novosphingobium soli]|uniref:Uncharacterized protein n=1 Tax=Novosphingobium soli TaxID=574956 RepID=A0ABV6CZH5_9SPHN
MSLTLVALVGVGIRLLLMMTVQQRRERANRQINERLRTLIAAYRALGGSFTGDLAVDPRHRRDFQNADAATGTLDLSQSTVAGSDRARRIRDAVEAALSDIILLGTDEQVRLASAAATELVGGRPVRTHELVVSLRDFIRQALDLDPIAASVVIPPQGPVRPASGGTAKGRNEGGAGDRQGGGGGMMGGGGGGMHGDVQDENGHPHHG